MHEEDPGQLLCLVDLLVEAVDVVRASLAEQLIASVHLRDQTLHHLGGTRLVDHDPALHVRQALDGSVVDPHLGIDQVDLVQPAQVRGGDIVLHLH